jgi:hypothetical protein
MPASLYTPEAGNVLFTMMSEGKSVTQVAVALGVRRATIYDWAKNPNHPEFKEALEAGQEASEAWWEELGRQQCMGLLPKVSPVSYIYNMKCRFRGKWLDDGTTNKLEITTKHDNNTNAELVDMIRNRLGRTIRQVNDQPGELITIDHK